MLPIDSQTACAYKAFLYETSEVHLFMHCRLFDMAVTLQQGNASAQSLVFHPWQASTPDANISNVNATAVITSGGITDNVSAANLQYRLFLNSSSASGASRSEPAVPEHNA